MRVLRIQQHQKFALPLHKIWVKLLKTLAIYDVASALVGLKRVADAESGSYTTDVTDLLLKYKSEHEIRKLI